MLKKLMAIFLSLLLILSVCACDSTEEAYIYVELKSTPVTVDPQIASTESELLIVRNMFEGLMRKDNNGKIVPAAAKDYVKNGLTYTFYLNEGLIWSDGTPLTAYDFAFGLKRALLPETKAPFASRLYAIDGAANVHKNYASANDLGVTAVNDTTLIIELEYEDDLFLETLATSVAMPCNEEFFIKTDGQYGLFAKHTLSNGSYEFTTWRKDPFGIRLYKNDNYNGKFTSNNAAVFLTCDKDETPFERLSENDVDVAFIETTEKDAAEKLGLNTYEIGDICWFLTMNNDFSQNMRKSLSMLVGGEVYSKDLKSGYSVANTIYPDCLQLDFSPSGITAYNLQDGKNLYLNEVEKLPNKKFPPDIVLYYYDDGNVKNVVTDIVGHWQSNLSAFVNIKTASSPDLLVSQINSQDYQMAIFPVKLKSGRLDEYLEMFGDEYKNLSFSDAQIEILSSNNIIPIMFQTTNISYSSALNNLTFNNDNGYIDFSFIIKTE